MHASAPGTTNRTAAPSRQRVDALARADAIAETARGLAEAGGWHAVTSRSLADAMGFTQPVLYRSFPSMGQVQAAVAERGFRALAERVRAEERIDVPALIRVYLAFADEQPAVYEAMFTLAPHLAFATDGAPDDVQAPFALLVEATGDAARAELLWAALHGLVELERAERIPRASRAARAAALAALFTA